MRNLGWIWVWIAAIGLGLSLWVHIGAVMGFTVAPFPLFVMLHVGIFVVWIPACASHGKSGRLAKWIFGEWH